ncbi:MAG: transporter substrate-binding domain-containing protein, partial [Veillonella sp.]|nr:transporter substrate-binding domain-containing protein [Veillonella sp.]
DYDAAPLGIAVKKGNTELLGKINDGLAKIKANGKYAEIYKKWFGKEPPAEDLK